MTDNRARLEELRTALRAESISYGDLAELQNLVEFIDAGDVELLEAAGVPEGGAMVFYSEAADRGVLGDRDGTTVHVLSYDSEMDMYLVRFADGAETHAHLTELRT